jgi:EAL domain-containing protein (putative c-di-GMP-specific phosphodiesterase class I)/pSer/pThr/pTyr-binding forkhead associated (FHA) protein
MREDETTRQFRPPARASADRSPAAAEKARGREGAGARKLKGAFHLESHVEGSRQLRRIRIHPVPFRIGRRAGLDLVLSSDSVSKTHAEIYWAEDGLHLHDLGSTNGTFLNRQQVDDALLREGDIVHFADFEFRLAQVEDAEAIAPESSDEPATVALGHKNLPHKFIQGTRELKELIRDKAVTTVFQPIVLLPKGTVVAYEALGRGRHPGLPESPTELFKIAETIGLEAELSRLFRWKAVELVRYRTGLPKLFLNTHAAELEEPGLLESLKDLREMAPWLQLALEIHESVLADPAMIATLRSQLSAIQIGLAYDDFGAGQARLLELGEAPPNYLKFDIRFVAGIDHAPSSKRRLLTSLITMARDLLMKTVAEGIETPGEAEVCSRLGFTHAQGFHFGRPIPADLL